jgi:hypothetical protein
MALVAGQVGPNSGIPVRGLLLAGNACGPPGLARPRPATQVEAPANPRVGRRTRPAW